MNAVAPKGGRREADGGSPRSLPTPASRLPPRKKGPRPKHIPQRMCAACRERDAKRTLYRIVRTPEGQVEPDPSGRRNGRGAYLCSQSACWQKALGGGILERALNIEIDEKTKDALRGYAATLPLESLTATTAGSRENASEGGTH